MCRNVNLYRAAAFGAKSLKFLRLFLTVTAALCHIPLFVLFYETVTSGQDAVLPPSYYKYSFNLPILGDDEDISILIQKRLC